MNIEGTTQNDDVSAERPQNKNNDDMPKAWGRRACGKNLLGHATTRLCTRRWHARRVQDIAIRGKKEKGCKCS